MVSITAITRTYNNADTLTKTLDSVMRAARETEHTIQHIVIDDGSTDESIELARAHPGPDRVIQTEHSGSIPTLNEAVEETSDPLFVVIDSDDRVRENIFDSLYRPGVESVDSSVGAVHGDYVERFGAESVERSTDDIRWCVLCGVLFNRAVVASLGGFDSSIGFSGNDMLYRILGAGHDLQHEPTTVYEYYRREGSMVGDSEWVETASEEIFERHGIRIRDYRLPSN